LLAAEKAAATVAPAVVGVGGAAVLQEALNSNENKADAETTSDAAKATGADSSGTGAQKPEGVPEGWKEEPGKKDGNTKWVNPDNPHDYVRVKPDGTVTQVRDGKAGGVKHQVQHRFIELRSWVD
jgi:hypothetical protein